MSLITLLSRSGCHLCEVAHHELIELQGEIPFELVIVDVDTDSELRSEYGDQVPVVLLNHQPHSFFRVDRSRLIASLDTADG